MSMQHSCRNYRDVALLFVRLIVGGIFIYSGWLKVVDMPATVGYFAQMGIPAFFAYAVGYLEFIGGIMLVLGLYTCLVAGVLGVIMLFAIWYMHSTGFQGFATPLATLAALLALFAVCGGKYSFTCACGSSSDSCCGKSCGCEGARTCGDGTCGNAPAGR